MAYLGNAPVVGDSTNTFKLLDDIASFTLTFDGSSADVVSVANDTLTFANHRFVTGQRVTYGKGGGTVITGLTDGTAYFIIKVDQSTIKLATNASNAASSTAIDLTGLGAGTSHTLNVAFDGVNTKFKATHSNGTKASVSRAAQLSLSINGVIQQPTEAKPPTVGYGIEADSTIVFSTAPSVADKVFGSFIGEVAPSFDLTDNTVNNFTGDGSTSTFNLSKEIPSNNDVLVTLDGVTQHPSDGSTTRAYSVVGSSLIFVSAPADGVAIQARLIGFAGATTSEVTGFYGRTGNVALKSTDDITFQNANVGVITASKFVGVGSMTNVFVSGITSFTNATDSTSSSTGAVIVSGGVGIAGSLNVGGSVSVGGTLTYEDVTNIDSVGIITARSNILVGTGITLSPDGDVFATGISTFSEGFAGDILIDDKIVHRGDTNAAIRFPEADTVSFETDGSEAFRINSGQKILVGSTAQRNIGGVAAQSVLAIEGTTQNRGSISLINNQATGTPPSIRFGKTRGTSVGAVDAVTDGDQLGQIRFSGSDGTDLEHTTAMIAGKVNGTVSSNIIPTDLVFETSATDNSSRSEKLRITSDGQLLVNVTTARGVGGTSKRRIQVEANDQTAGISIVRCSANATPPTLDLGKARGSTVGSNTIVQDDDKLGTISFSGADGTDIQTTGVQLIGEVDGTPGDNDVPARFIIKTRVAGGSLNERMRVTSDGTINIGAASPTASENGQLNVYVTTASGKAQIVHSSGTGGLRLAGTGSGSGSNLIFSNDYNSGTFSDHWCISHDGGTDALKFKSGGTGGSQRIQVKSDGEIIDYRDGNGDVFEYYRVSTSLFVVDNLSNESNTRMRIRNPNGTINYNSSSDYRLKENDVKITDGITRLKKLRPITFNWKSGTNTYDGFFAHEVSEACPMAVDGTKDQVATADDVTKGHATNVGDPIYQGIDHGKMVPLLTAALQEAIAKIEVLENKVSALEG